MIMITTWKALGHLQTILPLPVREELSSSKQGPGTKKVGHCCLRADQEVRWWAGKRELPLC